MFAAILDTCVLWPSTQRDFLLSLAVEGAYRPMWSEAILEELAEHETLKLQRRGLSDASERAAHLLGQMRSAFDDAIVQGWEGLEGSYGLPDPDDEHLVAAAVVGGAGAIVTENLKDLPADLMPVGIEVQTAAEFLASQVALSPCMAVRAVSQIAARSGQGGRPKRSMDEILRTLYERYGLTDAVEFVRLHVGHCGESGGHGAHLRG